MDFQDKDDEEKDASKKDVSSETDDQDEEEDSDEVTSKNGSDNDEEEDDEDLDDAEVTKRAFTNPNSLPPKLRPVFKKMQAQFTKKMQAAALVQQHARAFQQLVVDPDFRKWAEQQKANLTGKSSKRTRDDEDDDEDTDDDAPVTKKDLLKMFDRRDKASQEKEQTEKYRTEVKQFKKKNPDWAVYKDQMNDLLEEHPTMSYALAYKLAKQDSDIDEDEDDGEEVVTKKKKANLSKPSENAGKTTDTKVSGKKKSIWDSYQNVKKKMRIR